jgi:hypothetical protein
MAATFEKTDRSPASLDSRLSRRVTATETISGRPYVITLERDENGHYREVHVSTLERR